jgi:hypothetical protein
MLSRWLAGSNRQRVDCVHGFSCRRGRGRSLPAAEHKNIAGANQHYSKQSANFHLRENFFSDGIFMQYYRADAPGVVDSNQGAENQGRIISEHITSQTKQYLSIFTTHTIVSRQNAHNQSYRTAAQTTLSPAQKDCSVYMCTYMSNKRVQYLDLLAEQRFQHMAHGALEFAVERLAKNNDTATEMLPRQGTGDKAHRSATINL